MEEDWAMMETHPGFQRAMQDREFARDYQNWKGSAELAQTILKTRKEKGLSQEELARRIGSTQPSLSRLENGKVRDVGMDLLRRIGSAMGMEPVVEFRSK